MLHWREVKRILFSFRPELLIQHLKMLCPDKRVFECYSKYRLAALLPQKFVYINTNHVFQFGIGSGILQL